MKNRKPSQPPNMAPDRKTPSKEPRKGEAKSFFKIFIVILTMYILSIFSFTGLYYAMRDSFYHSMSKYELSLKSENEFILNKIACAFAEQLSRFHGNAITIKSGFMNFEAPVIFSNRIISANTNYTMQNDSYKMHEYLLEFNDGRRFLVTFSALNIDANMKTSLMFSFKIPSDSEMQNSIIDMQTIPIRIHTSGIEMGKKSYLSILADYTYGGRIAANLVNTKIPFRLSEMFPALDNNQKPTFDELYSEEFLKSNSDIGCIELDADTCNRIISYCKTLNGFPSESFVRMLYLSTMTITTVGYGDIVPITAGARILVMLEAILGVFLIGVVFTLLLSKYGATTK